MCMVLTLRIEGYFLEKVEKSRCQNVIGKGPFKSLSGCIMILTCYSNTSILYQGRESNS